MVAVVAVRSPSAGGRVRGTVLGMLMHALMAVVLRLLVMLLVLLLLVLVLVLLLLRVMMMMANNGSVRISVSPYVPALFYAIFDTFFRF